MDNACIPHQKHASRRDHMKTHGVKLPNRGHNSAPVIRSRAGLGGADRVDDHFLFASEPPAQRRPPPPLPCLRAGLACLELLAACGRVVPSNLDIPHTSVSWSQAVQLRVQTAASAHTSGSIIYVSSSTSSVHLLLGLFTSNSATFIRHFPHFACVFPRSASFLLFPSCLHFSHISTRLPPNAATPILY